MKKITFYLILLLAISSCEKETSVDGNGVLINATGSLLDSAQNCQSIIINGIYKKDSTLTYQNNIVVSINITTTGNYTIYTDTVNGYYFYVQGYAYTTGLKAITVKGFGKPIASVDANFKIHFGNSICYFKVKDDVPFVSNGTSNDYFPTTNLSHWTYFIPTISDTAIVAVLPLEKNIAGNVYKNFQLKIPLAFKIDTLYYRKDGFGNYYKYDTIGTGPKVEFQFLKDYANVGATWSSPIVNGSWQATTTSVKYFFTIIDKNITKTFGSNSFDSVINIKQETQYLLNGTFETKYTSEFSYAKKIGLVNVNQVFGATNINSPVKNYLIK